MHLMTFTVDGFAGAGVTLTALVLNDILEYSYNSDSRLLKLTDSNGKVTNISVSDQATWTITVASNYVTAVTIAN